MPKAAGKRVKIFIVGNIGSGKSTLGEEIEKLFSDLFHLIPEPVKQWQEDGILDDFYSDMEKMAFPMQHYAFSSRLRFLKEGYQSTDKNIVADGHVLTDKLVFKEVLRETKNPETGQKFINEKLDKTYELSFRDWMFLCPEAKPDLMIYLNTSPSVCLQRIKERARTEEVKISLDYLKALDTKFVQSTHDLGLQFTVAEINGNNSLCEVMRSTLRVINHKFPGLLGIFNEAQLGTKYSTSVF